MNWVPPPGLTRVMWSQLLWHWMSPVFCRFAISAILFISATPELLAIISQSTHLLAAGWIGIPSPLGPKSDSRVRNMLMGFKMLYSWGGFFCLLVYLLLDFQAVAGSREVGHYYTLCIFLDKVCCIRDTEELGQS